MFRVLTRATLMVIAPSAPVAWSPGTPPLSDALRARVRAGALSAAERAVGILPASGRHVVAVPVETAMRWVIGETPPARSRRVAMPVGAPITRPMVAPWGEPDPVPGVTLRTQAVPDTWLRRPQPAHTHVTPIAAVAEPRPAPSRSDPQRVARPVPTSVRVRKAAMMAFGLLVSLVAVEAAARVGRR